MEPNRKFRALQTLTPKLSKNASYFANIIYRTAAVLFLCCYLGQVSAVSAFSPVDWDCAEENVLTGSYTINPGSIEINFDVSPSTLNIDQVFLQTEPSERIEESSGFEANYIRRIAVQDKSLSLVKIALIQPVPIAMSVKLSLVQIRDGNECRLTINI